MAFLAFAAGVLLLTVAGLLIVESIARKLPHVRERRRRAKAEGSRTVKDHPDRVMALLANPQTVEALDRLRDQINNPKEGAPPVALLPEPVTV